MRSPSRSMAVRQGAIIMVFLASLLVSSPSPPYLLATLLGGVVFGVSLLFVDRYREGAWQRWPPLVLGSAAFATPMALAIRDGGGSAFLVLLQYLVAGLLGMVAPAVLRRVMPNKAMQADALKDARG
jgi:hypothetical protein